MCSARVPEEFLGGKSITGGDQSEIELTVWILHPPQNRPIVGFGKGIMPYTVTVVFRFITRNSLRPGAVSQTIINRDCG